MLGNRRPSPQVILLFSVLLSVLAGIAAYRYAMAENWLFTAIFGVLALWLLADAWRAYGWSKNGRPMAEQPSEIPRPAPKPTHSGPVSVNPETTGAATNPLLQKPSAPTETRREEQRSE